MSEDVGLMTQYAVRYRDPAPVYMSGVIAYRYSAGHLDREVAERLLKIVQCLGEGEREDVVVVEREVTEWRVSEA